MVASHLVSKDITGSQVRMGVLKGFAKQQLCDTSINKKYLRSNQIARYRNIRWWEAGQPPSRHNNVHRPTSEAVAKKQRCSPIISFGRLNRAILWAWSCPKSIDISNLALSSPRHCFILPVLSASRLARPPIIDQRRLAWASC